MICRYEREKAMYWIEDVLKKKKENRMKMLMLGIGALEPGNKGQVFYTKE